MVLYHKTNSESAMAILRDGFKFTRACALRPRWKPESPGMFGVSKKLSDLCRNAKADCHCRSGYLQVRGKGCDVINAGIDQSVYQRERHQNLRSHFIG